TQRRRDALRTPSAHVRAIRVRMGSYLLHLGVPLSADGTPCSKAQLPAEIQWTFENALDHDYAVVCAYLPAMDTLIGGHTMVADNAGKLGVFISYSRNDLRFADQLDIALGIQFATTPDRPGISGGEDWKRRVGNLIRDADTVVFVLSPASATSGICHWEVVEAVRLGKRILPVLCRPLDDA